MKMSLQVWANNGWLRSHKTSREEIGNLLEIVQRDLKDAQGPGLSADWRFGIAYNAALKLCTVLMYCEGFRPEKNLAHYRTLQALPLILGKREMMTLTILTHAATKETQWNMIMWVGQLIQMLTSLSYLQRNSRMT
jgi:hypothetical protein